MFLLYAANHLAVTVPVPMFVPVVSLTLMTKVVEVMERMVQTKL
jgi:hypothetical protein